MGERLHECSHAPARVHDGSITTFASFRVKRQRTTRKETKLIENDSRGYQLSQEII